MEAEGAVPALPPNPAPHLVSYLMEIGPVEPAGMDTAPVSWATLSHWSAQTGIDLPPWQARLIRRLSADYVIEMRRARDGDCPAPWGGITPDRRSVVDRRLRAAFGGMVKR